MALVVKDRVKETTSTTGTGTISLGGAQSNFVAFSSALSDGDTTYYAIVDNNNVDYEVGLGTYASSGNTLARTTVLDSSNGGALVNFSAGQKDVFITYPADKALTLDANDQIAGNQTFSGLVTLNSGAYVTGTLSGPTILSFGGAYGVTGDFSSSVIAPNLRVDYNGNPIELNYGSGDRSSTANGHGIKIQDAVNSSTDASMLWNATDDTFDFSHGVTVEGDLEAAGLSASTTSGNANLNVSATGFGGYSNISLVGGFFGGTRIGYYQYSLSFGTITGADAAGFSEKMTLTNTGRLGINQTNPQELLQVDGTARANELKIGSSSVISSSRVLQNVSIASAVTGVTQTSTDNSTKLATTAFVQAASGGPDYETGTWTPKFWYAFSSSDKRHFTTGDTEVDVFTNSCRYTKIGDMVTCWFEVTFSLTSAAAAALNNSGSFNLSTDGLPFTVTDRDKLAGTFVPKNATIGQYSGRNLTGTIQGLYHFQPIVGFVASRMDSTASLMNYANVGHFTNLAGSTAFMGVFSYYTTA